MADELPDDPTRPQAPAPESRGAKIRRAVAAMQQQGADDSDIEEYLQSQGIHATEPAHAAAPATAPHPAYKSPYAQRQERAALNETLMQRAKRVLGEASQGAGDAFDTGARHVLNAAQGLPGMKAFEAGMGSLGSKFTDHPMSYRESLSTLDEETQKIPETLRLIEQIGGGAALMPTSLPGALAGRVPAAIKGASTLAKAAGGGAAFGAAEGLLNADPDRGLVQRGEDALKNSAIGAIGGTVAHGVTNFGKTLAGVAKANLPEVLGGTPSLGKQVQQMARERKGVGALYTKAFAEAGEATPAIKSFLQEPEIAARVEALQKFDKFKGMSPEDPRFIDELYKSMSDEVKSLGKGLQNVDPSKANVPRTKMEDLKGKQQRLLSLLEKPDMKPAMHFDVPAEKIETDALYSHRPGLGRDETLQGHVMEGRAGRARGDQGQVALGEHGDASMVAPGDVQGPAGPAFQLKADPDRMLRPGVSIETPAMRIQTAPAEPMGAMMPGYRSAVEGAAEKAGERTAFRRGLGAMRTASKTGVPSEKELMDTSIEGMREWASKATPEEKRKALNAVLGSAAAATGKSIADPASLLLGGAGFMTHGPGGALAAAALRGVPAAARAHVLRQLLDPLGQSAMLRALAGANAGVGYVQQRKQEQEK